MRVLGNNALVHDPAAAPDTGPSHLAAAVGTPVVLVRLFALVLPAERRAPCRRSCSAARTPRAPAPASARSRDIRASTR